MGKLSVKRPETWVPLCLDMSLRADWEALDEQLRKAQKSSGSDGRMTGNAEATRLAEEIRNLEDRMESETAKFRLRALPRNRWAELVAAHPPRDGDDDDKNVGLNRSTFFDAALVEPGVIVEVVQGGEPMEFDPVAEWESLADDMTDQQYTEFANAVFLLNRGKVSIPFSRAASRKTQTSDET